MILAVNKNVKKIGYPVRFLPMDVRSLINSHQGFFRRIFSQLWCSSNIRLSRCTSIKCTVYLAAHDELVAGSHVPYPAASVFSLS